jgi:hypothetical protein
VAEPDFLQGVLWTSPTPSACSLKP